MHIAFWFNTYSIIKLFSSSSAFLEMIYGLAGGFVFPVWFLYAASFPNWILTIFVILCHGINIRIKSMWMLGILDLKKKKGIKYQEGVIILEYSR